MAAADKEPRQSNRWASSIAWLIVLVVSLVYHYANERLVAQRELPVRWRVCSVEPVAGRKRQLTPDALLW